MIKDGNNRQGRFFSVLWDSSRLPFSGSESILLDNDTRVLHASKISNESLDHGDSSTNILPQLIAYEMSLVNL